MTPKHNTARTGAQLLVDQLVIQGITHAYCVPGESYLAVLDALRDSGIALTVCRQEGGAAMMAEAHGKLTGRPGVCFVTRGPGATNAAAGVHVAKQDSTPMILFVGQVERGFRGREAFQEIDIPAVFGPLAKWAVEIDSAERVPEIVSRAFHVAASGRPGPVVIGMPEDMLSETALVADCAPAVIADPAPSPDQVSELLDLLSHAKRPVLLLGGSRWNEQAVASLARFAERWALPVAVSFRRQNLFPADSPSYIGDLGVGPNPKLAERVRASDLILLIGGRLSENPSQAYTLLEIPLPKQPLVHIHPDAAELGRVYQAQLAINTSPATFAAALNKLSPEALPAPAWAGATGQARLDYLAWSDPKSLRTPGALQMPEVMAYLIGRLPADAIVCNGAGNYTTWVHRFYPFRRFGTQLAPVSGSMGYGVPAAIAAKRIHPEKTVISFAGDGCFLMHGQEFATAVQYALAIIIIVVDNAMYGTIRMHQEREYPGRVFGTTLRNPDFAAYARAFGGHGERIEKTDDFAPAFERALASGKPSILHCLIDPEAITPSTTLSAIRAAAGGK